MGFLLWFVLIYKIPKFWRWKLWDQNFVLLNSGGMHIKESKKKQVLLFLSSWEPNFSHLMVYSYSFEKFSFLHGKLSGEKKRSCLSCLIKFQLRSSTKFTEMLILKIWAFHQFLFNMKFTKIQNYNLLYHSRCWNHLLSVLNLRIQVLNQSFVRQAAFMEY